MNTQEAISLCNEISWELGIDQTLGIYGTRTLKITDPLDTGRMLFFVQIDAVAHAVKFFEWYMWDPLSPTYSQMLSSDLIPLIESFQNWNGDPITEGFVILAGMIAIMPYKKSKQAKHSVLFSMEKAS